MSHAIKEAKELLQKLEVMQLKHPKERGADSILVIPEVINKLRALIDCAESIKGRDKEINATRQELLSAIQALRIDVWQINDSVARATGHSDTGSYVPVKPLALSINNLTKIFDELEKLIERQAKC